MGSRRRSSRMRYRRRMVMLTTLRGSAVGVRALRLERLRKVHDAALRRERRGVIRSRQQAWKTRTKGEMS